MKALFVNENLGGHATLHRHLRASLDARHPDVHASFLDVPKKGPIRKVLSARVPPLDRLDVDLQQARFQLAQSAQVRLLLKPFAGTYDVIHFYSQSVALTSVRLLRSVPSIVGTDVTGEQHALAHPFRRPTRFTPKVHAATSVFEARAYDAATLVIAQSDWVAESLRDRYGVGDDRLRMIPYGIVIPDVAPATGNGALPRLTFVGNPWAGKGGDLLLDVWRQHFRGRATLTFVTTDPVPVEPGVEVISDLRPGDLRLWELLAATDVFVFPSAVDKSSYAVVEAMAAGVPVVTTDVAALPELVGWGEAGLTIPPDDPGALAESLERLLGDDDLRARLGAAGYRRARERFDADITTSAVVEAMREAVERHG